MTVRGDVVRSEPERTGTKGWMRLDNGFASDTLELNWHDNERGRSCTVADTYHGEVWYSPTFNRLVIRLEDKHGRQDCLVHHGNFAADREDLDGDGVAEAADIRGCTIVGHGFGLVPRKDGRQQFGIRNSVKALEALIASLRDELQPGGYHDVILSYRWGPGCEPG